ncbi:olfactory receptor 5B12-like [Gastrophryne carolinensis]
MGNLTLLTELVLLGLSDLPSFQLPLFFFFLLIYLLTITWNFLIISLIITDFHLHTPMYFFLGNLACLDLCSSSVIIPLMLHNLLTGRKIITTKACLTQLFFFLLFVVSEVFLLSVMSYDRYMAVCHPLHYVQIMSRNVCVQLAAIVWSLGFSHALIHTLFATKLKFCRSDLVESFFCDLPQLFQISCSDIYANTLLVFLLGGIFGIGSLILTLLPYAYIFHTVLKLKVRGKRGKVFSTCSSHLTVVFIFYSSFLIIYIGSSASNHLPGNKEASVFYTVVTPLLNPLIYSLRNQDFIKAFRGGLLSLTARVI